MTNHMELADETQLTRAESLMKKCCQLLRELASFPTYCTATQPSATTGADVAGDTTQWSSLPDWLQLLCLGCCCVCNPSCVLDLTAAASLIDFVALTLSTTPASFWKPQQQQQPLLFQQQQVETLLGVTFLFKLKRPFVTTT